MAFTRRGLRIVEALGKYAKEKPNYCDTGNVINKLKFTAANENQLKASMTVEASMCNGYGVMHGGYMSLIIDVMSLYAHVARKNGKLAYTTNLSVNFIEIAVIGDKVIAEASTVKGGSSPVMETKLYKENGTIIATGMASFVNGNEKLQLQAPVKMGFDVLKSD